MAFGCLISGSLLDHFGRKMSHLILNVPFVISWCIISMSGEITTLLFGRSLTGFCAGILSPVGPTYLAEISSPEYRGLFLGSVTFAISFGVLITHLLAIYVKWSVNALICGLLPLSSYVLITFAPESPSWLLRKNRLQDAYESFVWLRGSDENSIKEFESMVEAQQIPNKQQPNDLNENITNCKTLNNVSGYQNLFGKVHELISEKSFNRPWLILSVYFATLQFSGNTVIIFYTVSIFRKSIDSDKIDEYTATIIIDSMRLVASFIACIIMKNVGRRFLTIFSGISTVLCLFSLSFYSYIATVNSHLKDMAVIPLIIFAIYIFVLSIGISPLPWCLTSEMFPLRFRAVGVAFVTFFNFLCFFGVVKTSPVLFATYGPSNTFFIYAIFTMAGTIFLIAFLPETKNISLQEIENRYNTKPKRNINRNKIQP